MGRKNSRMRKDSWRTPDEEIFDLSTYGIGEPQGKKGMPYITLADREEETTMEKTPTLQERLKVEKTPTVEKKITNIEDYPQNAVIISIGPANAGKTRRLVQFFGKELVHTYSKMKPARAIESKLDRTEEENKRAESIGAKRRKQYIKTMQCFIGEKSRQMERIVVDSPFLDEEFRNQLYKAAKQNGRPVYIYIHDVTREFCLEQIEKKYANREGEPDAERHKQRSIEGTKASYKKYLKAIQNIEKELKDHGMIQPQYGSQVIRVKPEQKESQIAR